MEPTFVSFTVNSKFGKVRRVVENGVTWLVAPITSITADGVLPGSRGSLLYPSKETQKAVDAWNFIPLVENHPTDNANQHVPAEDVPEKHLGHLRNSRWEGALKHQAWFDEERVKQLSPVIHAALLNHRPLNISTGLYTTNVPAPDGYATNSRGRPYTAVATNHRPDHMAVLPTQQGACPLPECGLLVNKMTNNISLDDWLDEHDMDEDEFEEMADDRDMTVEELEEELGITENDANFSSEDQRKFMWSQHPDIAEDWAHGEHSSDKDHKMPEETGEDVHVASKKATANMKLDDAKRAAIWNQLGQFLLNGNGEHSQVRVIPERLTKNQLDEVWLTYNRDWPQRKRDKLDDKDFAGPDQSFPITTQEDLDAAVHSIGRAKDPDTVKAGIRRIAKKKGLKLPDTETWNAHPQQGRHSQDGTYLQMAHTAAQDGHAALIGTPNGPGDDGRNQTKIKRVAPIDIDGDDDGPHDDDTWRKVDEEEEHTAEVPDMPSKRLATPTGNANPEGINQYSGGGGSDKEAREASAKRIHAEDAAKAKPLYDEAWKKGKKTGTDNHRILTKKQMQGLLEKHGRKLSGGNPLMTGVDRGELGAGGVHSDVHSITPNSTGSYSVVKLKDDPVANRYHTDSNEHVGPCPECGGEISGGVCKDCGHEMTENAMKKCPECGGEMKDGECEDCGYKDEETDNFDPDPHTPGEFAMMDKEAGTAASTATRKAGQATGQANRGKLGHKEAAKTHEEAAKAHEKAGNKAKAEQHHKMANRHKMARVGEAVTNCAMGGPMGNGDQAAGASKDAAMASMDHPPAREPAIQAHDAAQDGDSAAAVPAHQEAAAAHDQAAKKALKGNDVDGVNDHMKAAMLHRKAAAMHAATTNGAGKGKRTDNMALTLNQIQGMDRDQLLVVLTRNCKCDKEKGAYPNLNTQTLRKLVIANAKATGSNADTTGADGPGIETGGWDKKQKGDSNYSNDPGKGLDDDTDDEAEGNFEDEDDGGKHPATENELRMRLRRQRVDPVVANMAISHFREMNEKKRHLILNMLQRVGDNAERNRLGNKWFRLSLEDLQDMAKVSGGQTRNRHDSFENHNDFEDELMPVANYAGADSFDQLTANGDGEGQVLNQDADDDFCMNAGRTLDMVAVSSEGSTSPKWRRFLAERNGRTQANS